MTKKILIIDDDPDCVAYLSFLLKSYGLIVSTAFGAQEGLKLALAEKFDLILCDVVLPGVGEYELIQQMRGREELKQTPIIAMSAYGSQKNTSQMLAAGFNDYIVKPIEPDYLIKRLEKYLGEDAFIRPPLENTVPELPKAVVPNIKATLLLVDNVMSNLEFLKTILEPQGYRIETAATVDEALSLLKKNSFDLVVTDLNMPFRTGWDLLQTMRDSHILRRIPVLVLTASILTEEDKILLESMASGRYLSRPIDPRNLISEIESILKKVH